MAFDGTLKFDTEIDQSSFNAGLDNLGNLAKTGLSGLGDIAKASMAAVTSAVSAVSGEVLNLGRSAVDVGMNFESGMSQVIATMGITKDTIQDGVNSYELLSQAAQDAGASTTFSATEAAGALNYLALAGYDATTAAESLPAVLNLAAAGNLQLQYAADLATDAMAALGIEASNENLTHFGDQMAVTASKANTSVAQLGEAILTVGGTAKSLAGGTAELNAALGVLANRGIKGAEGGTALRNMILSLSAPTDKAAETLKRLGVEAYDADGNLRPLNTVFGDLNDALADMSEGEKTQVLNEIFNKVDLKSAQAMLAGCGEEFTNLTAALNDCDGAMQQMADTMNDTLEGDIKSLQSKAEALGITVYKSLNDPLRDLTQLGIGYIGQLTEAFNSGGFEGAAEAVGGILGDAVTKLSDYLPDVVGIGSRVVSSLLDGIAANSTDIIQTGLDMGLKMLSGFGDITVNFLDLGANLMSSLATGIENKLPKISGTSREILIRIIKAVGENLPVMLESGADIVEMLAGAIADNLDRLTVFGNQTVRQIAEAIKNALPVILQAGAGLIGAFGESILDSLPVLLDCAVQIMQTLVDVISNPDDLSALIAAGILIVQTLGGAMLDNLQPLINAGMQVIGALIGALSDPDAVAGLLTAGIGIIMGLVNAITQNVAPLASAAVQIITVLGTALINNIPLLLGAAFDIANALIQALADPGTLTGLLDAALTMITTLGTLLVENFSPLLGAVIQMIATLGEWIGEHALDLVSAGLEIVKALVDAVIQNLPLLLDAAVQIVEGLARGIEEDSADVLLAIEQIIRTLLDFLLSPDTLKKIGETGGKIIRALIPAAVELAGDLLGFAVNMLAELNKAMKKVQWGEAAKHIGEGLWSGLLGVEFNYDEFFENFWTNWAEGFKEIWDNTVQGFKDFWNDILDIDWAGLGGDIISGIINGIQDVDLGPLNGVKDTLLTGMKALFEIESPSKLMKREVGEYLGLGTLEGFVDGVSEIGDEAAEAFTNIPQIPLAFDEPEMPDIPEIEMDIHEPDMPEPDTQQDDIEISLAEEAVALLKELRNPPVPASIDPAALEMMLTAPPIQTENFISPTSSITNHYVNNSVVNTNTDGNTVQSVSGGDIIIPVQIGGEQVETIVITAAQIANARSGGEVL